jgi:RNA polymerase sigma-70 factor (ECF subfamily)
LAWKWGRPAVTNSNRTTLRAVLTADYHGLFRRLTRRLGSAELACEALHDTFLRLDRVSDESDVRSPKDFLFRIALNLATDKRRIDRRYLSAEEIDGFLTLPDSAPDPASIAEARSEIEALDRALAELPLRCREVFMCAIVERMADHEIASRLGVSVRTVEIDLRNTLKHCASRLGRTLTRRGGGPRPRS